MRALTWDWDHMFDMRLLCRHASAVFAGQTLFVFHIFSSTDTIIHFTHCSGMLCPSCRLSVPERAWPEARLARSATWPAGQVFKRSALRRSSEPYPRKSVSFAEELVENEGICCLPGFSGELWQLPCSSQPIPQHARRRTSHPEPTS